MRIRVRVPPSPYRLLKERYFGEETRNPRVARAALARLSARLPPAVVPIVSEAVHSLIDYQDPDYALAYLDRDRAVCRSDRPSAPQSCRTRATPVRPDALRGPDPGCAVEARGSRGGQRPNPTLRRSIGLKNSAGDEVIPMLPPKAAAPALDLFRRLRLARLSRRSVILRFSSRTRFKLQRLKWLAAARITRPFSERFKVERVWVERWLHMVDRSLVKHPDATIAIVRTASLIRGHGDAYQNGLAEWNAIIDGLVKPTCDGTLPLCRLGDAIQEARDAAIGEQAQGRC